MRSAGAAFVKNMGAQPQVAVAQTVGIVTQAQM
jgi:hypothetical protein